MLETPCERVKLLKAGISGKKIEEMYILYNNYNIINIPLFYELVEIHSGKSYCFIKGQDAIAEMCF